MKINIAIDGPSAAGKTTIAAICAKELGYIHLDTGAMYRCVAYLSKQLAISEENEVELVAMIKTMKIEFDSNANVFVNKIDVTKEIRTSEMSMRASNVSKLKGVRESLVALQKEIAKEKGYILDGRDIGTVVLPDAELKIFLVASVEARSLRRINEYRMKQIEFDPVEVQKDIEKRDYQDTHRENSPLKKAEDAIEIDTSSMSIDEVNTRISELLNQVLVKEVNLKETSSTQ